MKRVNLMTLVGVGIVVSCLSLPADRANAQILTFDSVDASAGAVDATSYLNSYGITLSGVTAGTEVAIQSDQQFYGTPGIVYASSPHNFLEQFGNANGESFTLNFATPLTSLAFTRITETGGPGKAGNSFGQWSAEAFEGATQIGQYGESAYSIFGPASVNSAQTYTFSGSGITSIQFDGNAFNFYGTGSILLDDLTLTPVPEPSSLMLTGLGLLWITRRWRNRS
jgi:hypothetical protein